MGKFFLRFFLLVLIVVVSGIIFLSYFGLETDKFDSFIKSKANTVNENVKLEFNKTKIPQSKVLPLEAERGFNKMPKASEHDLFFDIEGLDKILNPEESDQDKQGIEYLFGIYDHDNKKEPYKYFWAHNQDEEKEKFIRRY